MIGRQTHTYVKLAISLEAFMEIKGKLTDAGYDHAFMENGAVVDMNGIAIEPDPEQTSCAPIAESYNSRFACGEGPLDVARRGDGIKRRFEE